MPIQRLDVFDAALAAQKNRLTDVTPRGTLSVQARQVNVAGRALELINIAHSDDREELYKQACDNKI